ncbi:MAG: hypothetical protein JRF71_05450 [Deltaproteobacteria bacterium]|nr:hypothetical protein [Deltaproteobacteria bacterium]MBW2200265.1 hypothetical protein [Deltaproteobacteria bacterium]
MYALISALEKKGTIGLVPRREMEDILFQAGLEQGDCPEMALEIGKVLGINFVLFGRITKKVGRIETNVSLLDVQDGRVIKSWVQMFAGREDIMARIPSFAEELSDAILNGAHLAVPSAASAVQETQSQVAIENLRAKSKEETN